MPDKTNAAGGQPAARKPDAERALSSVAHYNTLVSSNFLCDVLCNGSWLC